MRSRALFGLVTMFVLPACGGEPAPDPEVVYQGVVRRLEFAREMDDGVSLGFNLDGFVSESNDGRSCFKEDFETPDGRVGVDNELARLLPLIDIAGEGAVQDLLQGSINEGRLLMIFEVVDRGGGTADVRFQRGDDMPLLGTDGMLLPGQTLALHEDPHLGEAVGARFEDGVLEAGPFHLELPVVVFSQLYQVSMPEARIRIELDEEGEVARATAGGGIPIEQLIDVVRTASNFAGDFEGLFGDAIRESGDLARTESGDCAQMSATVTLEAVPAFTW